MKIRQWVPWAALLAVGLYACSSDSDGETADGGNGSGDSGAPEAGGDSGSTPPGDATPGPDASPGGDGATPGSACAEIAQSFTACGGDVVGTWTFEAVCFEQAPIAQTPWATDCPDASIEFDTSWDGTITFDAAQLTVAWNSQTTAYSFVAPRSCVPSGAECADLSANEMSCAAKGELCVCSGEATTTDTPGVTMSYTLDGNNIVMTDPQGGEITAPYCRQGDKLVVYASLPIGAGQSVNYYQVLAKQ